jgi:ribonuclease HI
MDCMHKYIHTWTRNGWKLANGGPVVNREEVELLIKVSRNFDVKYVRFFPLSF